VECLKKTAAKHPRFGYRRAHALLRRQGEKINHKRVHRLWKREGLSVKRRIKKKSTLPKQERPNKAEYANHVWTVDFVQDQTISGRKLRMLSVTDEFTRQSLAITVGFSLTAEKVGETLIRLFAERGAPVYLRSDNGPEFVAIALRGVLHRSSVKTAYVDKGSPWQNGFAESFHSRFRDEFLTREVFLSLSDAKTRVELWRVWYNTERPHSSLAYATPDEFAAVSPKGGVSRVDNAGTNLPTGT
jgi:putative transposase